MVLADTSIWVDHFRQRDGDLEYLLNDCKIVTHSYIIGELACGNFKNRKMILNLLHALPSVPEITSEEYYPFLDNHRLYGVGLGFVDIHLLASALLSNCLIYTRDKSLAAAAIKLKIAFK